MYEPDWNEERKKRQFRSQTNAENIFGMVDAMRVNGQVCRLLFRCDIMDIISHKGDNKDQWQ